MAASVCSLTYHHLIASKKERGTPELSPICYMKRGNVIPLEHMGRYLQPHMGRNSNLPKSCLFGNGSSDEAAKP